MMVLLATVMPMIAVIDNGLNGLNNEVCNGLNGYKCFPDHLDSLKWLKTSPIRWHPLCDIHTDIVTCIPWDAIASKNWKRCKIMRKLKVKHIFSSYNSFSCGLSMRYRGYKKPKVDWCIWSQWSQWSSPCPMVDRVKHSEIKLTTVFSACNYCNYIQ